MARSPSGFRNNSCDCLSRPRRRTYRCPCYRSDARKDRRILSRIEEQIQSRSYQPFGSLDTQLTSAEGPQSPESTFSVSSYDNGSSVTSSTADLEEERHTSPPFVATPTSSDASFEYPNQQYLYQNRQDRLIPLSYPTHSWTWPTYGRGSQNCGWNAHPPV